tara:strand:- start:63751 stop:64149 length:399 start_codon:yes stop_codon:yes gene_type:complete
MKLRILLLLFTVVICSAGFAQSEFNKKVRDSEAFRSIAEKLGLEPGSTHTITTTYVIEEDGSLSNITASSKYPELEPEAIRIIGTLPKQKAPKTPGDNYIPHKITLPITYRVETLPQKKLRLRKETRTKKNT